MKKSSRKNRRKLSSAADQVQILGPASPFSMIEEYKTIRTNLTFSIPEDGCKVIGVTSSEALEGKSINCLNLAITFAQTGARVLLMDCDLRLPKIGRLLGMVSSPGISNVLVGLSGLSEGIQQTRYKGLDVFLSGNIPPNPSELLGSERMRRMLEELKGRYEYILIDTPPVNVVSDAIALSRSLTGVVLIVRAGATDRESVKSAVEQLRFVSARILGFILNAVQDVKSRRYKECYSKYGRYYRYGGVKLEAETNA